ncbi:hypothetical protein SR914_04040 [Comamonas testosteroni]|uniref:Uncharacterized protein n=1 Tax=Comamonas testosteroni (strain DSM 14576 / KF-1) TaxID=399795 RepID=B7WX54_COMTK|nr:hypothetical protein [Comamonas testosteroni]EED69647.1 hypothetical protein CtesDRAFT_PD4595 [Comamonas testosteroni KF-1]WQG67606.1 hypothetical protein SR914_04040 [Comamonas testosteroni]
MVTLTPEQFEHFIRVMILVALLGGLAGALLWDLIQASGLGMVSGIGYLFDRHKRIKAARERAADAFFASAAPAPVDDRPLICRGMFTEHDFDPVVEGDKVTLYKCRGCGQLPPSDG